jgi:hypothetical protein
MNQLLAAAVIEFVGLCMFKAGDAKYPVHVVLPNVQQTTTTHQHAGPVAGQKDIQLVQNDKRRFTPVITMDQHTAIIAWLGPPIAAVNWTPQTLKPVPQYQYVELKGEQIRIVASTANDRPTIPQTLPRVTYQCGAQRLIAPDYSAPNYAKAAGVVKIEAGDLFSCRPRINGIPASRVDTRLRYRTNGPIVIETLTKPVKRLTLKAADLVVIGNVPTVWVNSAPNTAMSLHGEAGHYQGFYTMLTGAGVGCQHQQSSAPECPDDGPEFSPLAPEPPNPDTRGRVPAAAQNPQSFRTEHRIWREGTIATTPVPTTGPCPQCFVTYACSNSQYP